jgi:hypothetical protein
MASADMALQMSGDAVMLSCSGLCIASAARWGGEEACTLAIH